jgi:histidinol-phosphate aminotransferase
MPDQSTRRQWLRNSAALLAGMSMAPSLFATEKERHRLSGTIYLNKNENAYGPSPSTKKAMIEAAGNSNRYPDRRIEELKKQVAEFWGVGPENILFGAGSSEIIGLCTLQASLDKGQIVTAEPSYKVWNSQAEAFGLDFKRISLDHERKHDLNAMLSAMDNNTRMVYICNPCNPVGTYVEDAMLRDFVTEAGKRSMILVDEAYTEFASLPSLLGIAVKNPHVVVAKTFSKIYGLAGARVGYAIAHPDTIKKLARFQPWEDAAISVVSSAGASAALKDQSFVKDCREKIAEAREICFKTFKDLSLDYISSHTNFILFNIDKIGAEFTKKMQAKNIFVQYRDHFGGKWCRVSMGTIEEMQAFCTALRSMVI